MSEKNPGYNDLKAEDSWIGYLRTRLPYSFMEISEEREQGRLRNFQLSDPALLTGMKAPEWHNFWKRGNVYYMTGKLLDLYSMSQFGRMYRLQEVLQLVTRAATTRAGWPTDVFTFYNSIQMEKAWGFVQQNHLDRERVMMTNIILAAEMCLKAVMTHATYSETGSFQFSAGHDVVKLFEDLPDSLQEEMVAESKVFAKDYLAFRTQVEAEIKEIHARRTSRELEIPSEQQAQEEWDKITDRIRESNYTAFIYTNDPGNSEKQLHDDWFKEALDRIRMVEDPHDISQYFRYAPQKDKDELPTDLIAQVLLLGRFLYEHLFPVPPDPDLLPLSGFPLGRR